MLNTLLIIAPKNKGVYIFPFRIKKVCKASPSIIVNDKTVINKPVHFENDTHSKYRKLTEIPPSAQSLMFVLFQQVGLATLEHNHRLNDVNNLPSRPAIKTINSCADNPLSKKSLFYLFLTFEHGILELTQFPD